MSPDLAPIAIAPGAQLRPLLPADVSDAYIDALNDPEVRQYLTLSGQARETRDSVTGFVAANAEAEDSLLLGFFLDGRHCGNIRLHDLTRDRGYIGIALFDRSIWGQGWAPKTLAAAAQLATGKLGCRRLLAGIDPTNTRSQRAFGKAGFHSSPRPTEQNFWAYPTAARLALGSAQFGLDYGITNQTGKLPPPQVGELLRQAVDAKLAWIDTASGYGDAESVIGQQLAADAPIRIVTKILLDDSAARGGVVEAVERASSNLNRSQLDAVLLHRPSDLGLPCATDALAALAEFRQAGRIGRFGVSVYDGKDVDAVIAAGGCDMVQLPLNIFDQRLLQSGHLRRLREAGIAIHVRSVFLQGLLLSTPDRLPAKLSALAASVRTLHTDAERQRLTPAALCLGFVLGLEEIEAAVVGVTNRAEFTALLQAADDAGSVAGAGLQQHAIADTALVDPRQWN